jgi:hypothetical protein
MATISCDPSTLAQQAKCFKCLGPGIATLLEVQVYLLCNLVNAGAAGSGATQVFAGNYGGASPAAFVTVTTTAAIAFDTSNGTQWNYYNGVWN